MGKGVCGLDDLPSNFPSIQALTRVLRRARKYRTSSCTAWTAWTAWVPCRRRTTCIFHALASKDGSCFRGGTPSLPTGLFSFSPVTCNRPRPWATKQQTREARGSGRGPGKESGGEQDRRSEGERSEEVKKGRREEGKKGRREEGR